MGAERNLARQWLAKAQNDLLNADNNLKSEVIPFDTICFHAQQAAEKLLKAYLVAKGIQPPITDDLLLLLEQILPHCADAETLRGDLALLMPYAVGVRYPDTLLAPTHEDAREARQAAQSVLEWLQFHLDSLFQQIPHRFRGVPHRPEPVTAQAIPNAQRPRADRNRRRRAANRVRFHRPREGPVAEQIPLVRTASETIIARSPVDMDGR